MSDRGHEDETIGERLKRLRVARGLSQRALSLPGVSYPHISRIEAGTRQPSVKAIRRLARKLDVTPAYLESGRDIGEMDERELRIADAELALRLGDAREAEERLHEVFADALRGGDRPNAARARIALALVAAERGDHAAAVAGFEEAFALDRPSPLERIDVYGTLARAYGALGRSEREVELLEECLAEVANADDDSRGVRTRYRILLSYALSNAGDFQRAEEVVHEAFAEASTDDDPYMRVRVYWSLARLSEMEGRSSVALRHARRAIALLEATEDHLHRARAHLLAAWIMNSSGNAAGARQQLVRAEQLFGDGASADDVAMLGVELARTEARLGNGAAAIRLAREAIDAPGQQYQALRGTAFWALAEGLAVEGDLDAADKAFARAVDLLSENRRWREASQACHAWGHALRQAGRSEQALDVLERAAQLALGPTRV